MQDVSAPAIETEVELHRKVLMAAIRMRLPQERLDAILNAIVGAAQMEATVALRALTDALPKCAYPQCQQPGTGRVWTANRIMCDEHSKGQDGDEFSYTVALRDAMALIAR